MWLLFEADGILKQLQPVATRLATCLTFFATACCRLHRVVRMVAPFGMRRQRPSAAGQSSATLRAAPVALLFIGCALVLGGCAAERQDEGVAASALPATATPQAQPTAAPASIVATTSVPPTRYTYEVVATYPHDASAFTQGLLFDGDVLYEGTGLYGKSSLRRVDLTTGTVLQQIALPAEFFGEGIALVADRLYQLTWREQQGFIYDKSSFEKIGDFTYPTEGWGLTFDGTTLIMSDGSEQLFRLDPTTMQQIDQIAVSVYDVTERQRKAVYHLNELEYIGGEIFANIWQTDLIVRIDPQNGNVTGIIDLAGLLPAADRTPSTDVLNGIAFRAATEQLYVTGKNWPKLFEIRLIEEQAQ